MEIKILENKPELNKKIRLIIEPLAPLSMVSDLPGTYYKVQKIPDKFKLCGLFENILGWQFSKKDRQAIVRSLKSHYKKKFKEKDYDLEVSNSGYQPLLLDFFEIGMVYKSESMNYNDLWKRSFRRNDEDVHPKGTPNIDYQKLREKQIQLKSISLKEFYKSNLSSFPLYYTTPTLREYTDYLGQSIQLSLKIDQNLLSLLSQAINECSSAYLGNSEGWVEIKIEEL